MQKNKTCKICGIKESADIVFHTHHVKPKRNGGKDTKANLVDICRDCHFSIHNPSYEDGDIELEDIEEAYKDAIASNIFSDGWGILPRRIARDHKISNFAKILYCDISSLCAQKGYCWANNKYFAKLFNVSERTVSRAIQEIEPYLVIRNRQSDKRTIWVHQLGDATKPFAYKHKSNEDSDFKKKLQKKAKPIKKIIEKFTEEDRFLAELLLQKIIYNFPTFENKKVNISEWAEDIRKLREIDKATKEQITFMITWLQGGEINNPGKPPRHFEPHEFWAKNILSPRKLRKQWFENLIPQLQESVKKIVKKSTVTQL